MVYLEKPLVSSYIERFDFQIEMFLFNYDKGKHLMIFGRKLFKLCFWKKKKGILIVHMGSLAQKETNSRGITMFL